MRCAPASWWTSSPSSARLIADLQDPLPLFLGMLLHDAGKGMGGDHSVRGKELMAGLGERLGLTPRQREVAEFLVLHHLTMSQTAQRRDLSDSGAHPVVRRPVR